MKLYLRSDLFVPISLKIVRIYMFCDRPHSAWDTIGLKGLLVCWQDFIQLLFALTSKLGKCRASVGHNSSLFSF